MGPHVAWADDELPEPEFFNALTKATGCQLLDVNNLVVNALNAGSADASAAAVG